MTPRFWFDSTDDYHLASTLDNSFQPVYAICDEVAGGFVAFTTSAEEAERIVDALSNRSTD